ncbi:MAG: D-2-hydroxyacid dehydrogenase [Kiritimatiellae bacterium]|nr:D-2-hydroxyacid dehydrogenase [Kiritimatiellia bacterium]
MNIVVFDAALWNPEPLPWTELQAMGEVRPLGTLSKDEIGRLAADAEAVFTWRTVLNREAIRAMPRLRYIGVVDPDGSARVNLDAATKRGITVCRVPLPTAVSVAEHVFAVMLELARGVGRHMHAVYGGAWTRSGRPCWWQFPLQRLAGRTVGLIGATVAAGEVVRRARAFDMRVLVVPVPGGESPVPAEAEATDLGRVLGESDVVVVLAPSMPETAGLLNAARLAGMKPGSWLIHVGGPGVVDEAALAEALRQGVAPAVAVLDRLGLEPPPPDHPLLRVRNCRITPHQAWAAVAARAEFIAAAARNLRAWLEGHPEGLLAAGDRIGPGTRESGA